MKFPFFGSKPAPAKEPVKVTRFDAFQNTTTGVGVAGRDKRLFASALYAPKTFKDLREFWQSDYLAARVVEAHSEEMTRAGWKLSAPDPQISELLEDRVDGMNLAGTLRKALNYQRALGGAAILMGVDDGSSDVSALQTPLDIARVKSLRYLQVFAADECTPVTTYLNPLEPKYAQTEIYKIEPKQGPNKAEPFLVHESRLLILKGAEFGVYETSRNGWGQPALERCFDAIRDFSASYQAAALLIQEFAQKIYKHTDLAQLLGSGKRDAIIERLTNLNVALSVANMATIDGSEELSRLAVPTTGLPELLGKMGEQVAAAAQVPVTVLFGQTPSGMNATGATEMRLYYDRVAASQVSLLKPILNIIYSILFKELKLEVPEFNIEFNPLWQMTELEQADLRVKMAQADVAYVQAGVLSPEEVVQSRFGAEFSLNTQVDLISRGATSEAQGIAEAPVDETQTA